MTSLLVSFAACAKKTVSPQDGIPASAAPSGPDEDAASEALPDPEIGPFTAEDISVKASAEKIPEREIDSRFISSQMRFSLDLFRRIAAQSGSENVVCSPLSVSLALAMTANGAEGKTREEMERVLGGGIPLEELNEYLYHYARMLTSGEDFKMRIANSVWFDKERLSVKEPFLQSVADYYGADVYRAVFDESIVGNVNAWVSENTDGKIPYILHEYNPYTVMYLVNALSFDAEWSEIYTEQSVVKGVFTTAGGEKREVEMMLSTEHYIGDSGADGFVKAYKGYRYSFAALLPKENVDILSYISSLTPETFLRTLSEQGNESAVVSLPKFQCKSAKGAASLKDMLISMGMPQAFQSETADFSGIGQCLFGDRLYISDVMHNAMIRVDEKGTSAGAATSVAMNGGGVPTKEVILDRPFVFAVIDNETMLPVFIGAVMDIT